MSEESAYDTVDPNSMLGPRFSQVNFEFVNQENWEVINRGGISKDFGASLYFNTGTSAIITGLYRFKRSSGSSYFIYSQGTKIYNYSGGLGVDIGATITNNVNPHFETANDYLIVCDGARAAAPEKWDGTTLSSLGGLPPNAVRQTLYTQNRLFLFPGNGETSYIYYSDAGNIEAGYASNFINCNRHNGQKITGIRKLFIPGELKPLILVTKENSMGLIDGDGSVSNPFTYKEIRRDIGCLNFRQSVSFEQDIAILTPKGVTSYRTATQSQNLQELFLSEKILNQFTQLSSATLPNALCWYDWKYDRLAFAVPTGDETYPNVIWMYHIRRGTWRKKTAFNVQGIATSALVDDDGIVYTGDTTGKIYKHDETVNSWNGFPIIATFTTPYLDFFEADSYKRIIESEIVLRGNGTYPLAISTSLNYGNQSGTNHSIQLNASRYVWGGGVWTDNPSVYQWGSESLTVKKFFPGNLFKNISFTVLQTGANNPVDIIDWIITVEYLNKR